MFDIAIVDDDVYFTQALLAYLQRFQKEEATQFHVKVFYNGVNFITDYRNNFDIVFMDIEMPKFNGLETAKELRTLDENVCLIFITNIAQYAINGYEVNALDFIVKPVSYFNFALKLKKAIQCAGKNIQEKIMLNLKYETKSVKIKDISYIEIVKHYLWYHIGNQVYQVRGTIGAIEEKLKPYGFARCNNCYLINLRYITSFCGNSVFVGGTELPISRPRKKQFIDDLTMFLGDEI